MRYKNHICPISETNLQISNIQQFQYTKLQWSTNQKEDNGIFVSKIRVLGTAAEVYSLKINSAHSMCISDASEKNKSLS